MRKRSKEVRKKEGINTEGAKNAEGAEKRGRGGVAWVS
jgi:hypothetical protein